jgi:hypothetical protein
MKRFRFLLALTPLETMQLVRRRLPILRNGPVWRPDELLWSSKHGRGIRFAEFLLRQEATVRRQVPWESFDFEGRHVVEIGCGPLAGYGPLAIFCGAASFESADPEWDQDLLDNERVVERYLRIFHADLAGLYGPRMDFAEFRRALSDRLCIHRSAFETAPIQGVADIVLSQSCIEHLFPIEATMQKLATIHSPRTRFLHLVDFGNHYPTGNPFEGLYEQPPADYIARRGKAINLLRVSDVAKLFEDHGMAANVVASRVLDQGYSGAVHPWWCERYDDSALFTQLALVVGPAS